jgi:hypothetical protein
VNHLIAKHAAGPVFGASPCSWSPRARCASTAFQELLGEVDGIVAVKPERDKAARMSVASAKFESGLVFLPERAPRLADFEAELFAFPGSRHDDQGDSVSQALLEDNWAFPMVISAEAVARSRQPGPRTQLDGGYYWPAGSSRQRGSAWFARFPQR